MIHGLDTGFLVAAEVTEHAEHSAARDQLARQEGGRLAAALHQLPGIGVIDGRGGHAWVVGGGISPSMCHGAIGMASTFTSWA